MTDKEPSKLVNFPNHGLYWLIPAPSGDALALLEHCDERGNIKDLPTALFSTSYAHVMPTGLIKRYGKVVGRREDLIFLRSDWPVWIHQVATACSLDMEIPLVKAKDAYTWLHQFCDPETKEWTDEEAHELALDLDEVLYG